MASLGSAAMGAAPDAIATAAIAAVIGTVSAATATGHVTPTAGRASLAGTSRAAMARAALSPVMRVHGAMSRAAMSHAVTISVALNPATTGRGAMNRAGTRQRAMPHGRQRRSHVRMAERVLPAGMAMGTARALTGLRASVASAPDVHVAAAAVVVVGVPDAMARRDRMGRATSRRMAIVPSSAAM